jgi:hypothetical protein
MVAMSHADNNRELRTVGLAVLSAAVAGLVAAPALAMGGFGFGGFHGGFHGGGFHGGGFHGGFHAGSFHVPPPPGLVPTPVPAFAVPPPRHIHSRFVTVHDVFPHEHFFGHDHRHGVGTWGWGWAGWGGGGVYASGGAEPVYVRDEAAAQAAGPAPCPELLTWSPKLRQATRQRLCDEVDARMALPEPRG